MNYKYKNRKKEYHHEYYLKNKDKFIEYGKKQYEKMKNNKEFRDARKIASEKYYQKHREKICRIQREKYHKDKETKGRAYHKVFCALRNGTLIKPDKCSDCNVSGKIVAHHDDYDKPLDVVWVCYKCHSLLHVGRK